MFRKLFEKTFVGDKEQGLLNKYPEPRMFAWQSRATDFEVASRPIVKRIKELEAQEGSAFYTVINGMYETYDIDLYRRNASHPLPELFVYFNIQSSKVRVVESLRPECFDDNACVLCRDNPQKMLYEAHVGTFLTNTVIPERVDTKGHSFLSRTGA